MTTLALQIAERIHQPRYEDITPAALEWTRTAFIDTVGVTLAGIVEDGPRILMQVPGIATSPGPSLIFATDTRTSALDARWSTAPRRTRSTTTMCRARWAGIHR